MKTLYLSRHAKSSWNNANMSDHARPLNDRGKRDAPEMGKRLRKRNPQPTIIISSSGVRAETTATILAEAIGFPISDITIEERLYGAEPNDVISIIEKGSNLLLNNTFLRRMGLKIMNRESSLRHFHHLRDADGSAIF